MTKRQTNRNDDSSVPPLELLTQFIENQSNELNNATQEIELKKLNEQNSFEYGCKALEAQKQDRKEQRAQMTLFMKYGFWLTIVILFLISAFIVGCIYTNNINIIISGLKVFAYILPSAIGGYFVGLNIGKKNVNASYTEAEEY